MDVKGTQLDTTSSIDNPDPQKMSRTVRDFKQGPSKNFVGLDATSSGNDGLLRVRIFRSRENWLSKGPQFMQVGDEVWIIPCALAAFILRRASSSTYLYVGYAYVHGIMQGEACGGLIELNLRKLC
jgi:hypothetical protein